jgi:ribonuclease HII
VTRDNQIKKMAEEFPQYKWESNKGYGAKHHIDMIKVHGITEHHRKSFLKNII